MLEPPASLSGDAALRERVVDWRRHLHRHPELSFEEHQTAAFIATELRSLEHVTVSQPTPTSVLGRLQGSLPGPRVALRADIDALPVEEQTGLEFASLHPGVMHACGHDGHTAMLLGVAAMLTELREELSGEVRFMFQHAEELPPGGARDLIAAGVLEGVSAVLGMHLVSFLPTGTVGVRPGPLMASCDSFEITVGGRGGHGAAPHEAVDPVAVAAQLVTNLQHVVSRVANPARGTVLSVTRLHAGTADNVIPETAVLGGTLRAFDPGDRDLLKAELTRIAEFVCAAHRARCTVDVKEGYPPLRNDPGLAALVAREVGAIGGIEVIEPEPWMAAEDFARYGDHTSSCFFFVGAGGPGEAGGYPHHHPKFDVDEDALSVGMSLMARLAWLLGSPGAGIAG